MLLISSLRVVEVFSSYELQKDSIFFTVTKKLQNATVPLPMFFKTLGTFLHIWSFEACTHKPIPADNFIKYNTNTAPSYSSLQSPCIVVLIGAYITLDDVIMACRLVYKILYIVQNIAIAYSCIFLFNSYFGFQDADSRTRFCVIFYEIVACILVLSMTVCFVFCPRIYHQTKNIKSTANLLLA